MLKSTARSDKNKHSYCTGIEKNKYYIDKKRANLDTALDQRYTQTRAQL